MGNDPQYRAKAGRDKFQPTAPDTKTPENYRNGPQKLAKGSPQPSQTMDDPGTLPLMGGHPQFGNASENVPLQLQAPCHETKYFPIAKEATNPPDETRWCSCCYNLR